MKNYNYLTKKEIDELIAEYEDEKIKLLKCGTIVIKSLLCRPASAGARNWQIKETNYPPLGRLRLTPGGITERRSLEIPRLEPIVSQS